MGKIVVPSVARACVSDSKSIEDLAVSWYTIDCAFSRSRTYLTFWPKAVLCKDHHHQTFQEFLLNLLKLDHF